MIKNSCETDIEDDDQDKENESLDPVDRVVQFNLQPTYHEIKQGKARCKSGENVYCLLI